MSFVTRPLRKEVEHPRSYASDGEQFTSVHGLADFTETRRLGPVKLEVRPNPQLWKGAAAGAIAGLAATLVMTRFQGLWSELQKKAKGNGSSQPSQQGSEESSDPTVEVADKISRAISGKELPKERKPLAGNLVHYGFGTSMGTLYGLLTEFSPSVTSGYGLAYGTALFLGADEVAVPALELTPAPAEVPLNKHVYGLASHLVYAAALEATRRLVRRGLERI